MPIIPVQLPPGFYRNGTPYTKRGRVQGGSLVRFHEGSYRPLGGWLRRREVATDTEIAALYSDATAEAVRDIIAWRSNAGVQNSVFFSNLAVYHLDSLGTATDITPGAYSAVNSSKDPDTSRGYGQAAYGAAAYGVTFDLAGADVLPPDRWYSDVFGEVLLFGSINNGSIFELDLSTLTTSVVTDAPTSNADICVTEERQVFVIGANGEPRRVQASAIEDRTNWTAAVANQVIDRTLPGNGKLLRCLPVQDNILILGEDEALVARYIGPPYVYSIEEIGSECGPLAPQTLTKASNFAVWWGNRNFWLYNGSIAPLECEVADFLYADLDPAAVSKIVAFSNSTYSEVWWLYQSLDTETTELDSYVMWDYKRNIWHTGKMARTAAVDKGVFNNVVMVDADGFIYNHELEGVFPVNGGSVFLETGPLDIQNGESNMAIRYIYPDQEITDGVTYSLIARQFSNDAEYTYGPYNATNPTPTRAIGRGVRIRADLNVAASEVGLMRLDVAPMGTGRR